MQFGHTIFYVDDVEKSMNFYEKAFGLQKGFLDENHQYGEMITGTTKIGFVCHDIASSLGFTYEHSHLNKNPFAIEIGFFSQDVESSFEKAVTAGAIPISPPQTKPWGQKVSFVRDCNGFLVEICSPLK